MGESTDSQDNRENPCRHDGSILQMTSILSSKQLILRPWNLVAWPLRLQSNSAQVPSSIPGILECVFMVRIWCQEKLYSSSEWTTPVISTLHLPASHPCAGLQVSWLHRALLTCPCELSLLWSSEPGCWMLLMEWTEPGCHFLKVKYSGLFTLFESTK